MHNDQSCFMNRVGGRAKPVAYLVVFGLVAVGAQIPAQAAIVATDAVVGSQQTELDRARIEATLDRDEVKQRLVASGVDPQQVRDRVAALSDGEIHALS